MTTRDVDRTEETVIDPYGDLKTTGERVLPREVEIDPVAYEAGSQYAELIADGFASASFDAVFEAAMLSACAYSFYAGLQEAVTLGRRVAA